MARNLDLDSAIRRIVGEEVERALAPYLDLLNQMTQFAGGGAPARPSIPTAPKAETGRKPRRVQRSAAASNKGDASKFSEGQEVRYRQGRGEFDAVITRIDRDNNVLFLERKSDHKKIERPASKVYA